MKTSLPSTVVGYTGPTALPGQTGTIRAVFSGLVNPSNNTKTGPMVQVWYIPELPNGVGAVSLVHAPGLSDSVCGTCPLRPSVGGGCYVSPHAGLGVIVRALPALPELSQEELIRAVRGKLLRFGAFGDPCAVPRKWYDPILTVALGWTGYTHAWRDVSSDEWGFLMASVESEAEHREAVSRGWRTFRAMPKGGEPLPSERVCPASVNAYVTCSTCRACSGTGTARTQHAPSIAIEVHGRLWRRFPSEPTQPE
jgi:hypothetical protein